MESVGIRGYFFAFRWLLVSFKREFETSWLLRLWETCWTCPFTQHLPIFLAAAVLVENRDTFLDEVSATRLTGISLRLKPFLPDIIPVE